MSGLPSVEEFNAQFDRANGPRAEEFMRGAYAAALARIAALEAERDGARAQVKRWEDKEVSRAANCCGAEEVRDAALARAERLAKALREVEKHCPCGARPESPATHPHVIGCPVGIALGEVKP